MENNSSIRNEHGQIQLPPGFRFHPTDEELITYYLSHKVLNSKFYAIAIGRTKMGEKEWYFFCVRDRKYPSGLRTNRATEAGYWKATGKHKEILEGKTLIGMKKTLVFYKGRAPKGVKTNGVLHEFRLEGNHSVYNHPKTAKEWVICRVFQKSPSGKKIHISGFSMPKSCGNNLPASVLPPLMDSSPHNSQTRSGAGGETSQATCFSDPIENQKIPEEMTDGFDTTCLLASPSGLSPSSVLSSKIFPPNSENTNQIIQNIENLQCTDSFWMQDHSFLKMLLENRGGCSKQNLKAELPQDLILSNPEMNQDLSSSAGEVDLGCLWGY